MLDEGRRRAGRGSDVVVGFVETHGRAHPRHTRRPPGDTAPNGRVPRRSFEEMDLAAVLARRPRLPSSTSWPTPTSLDPDHTTSAGRTSRPCWRRDRRVQHGERPAPRIAERRRREDHRGAQQETVPDSVVRAAEQVQLVDMTPEALRRRMAHGNNYPAEKVTRRSATTSGRATSPRCANSRCSGSPTGWRRGCAVIESSTASPAPGRPANASSSHDRWTRGRGADPARRAHRGPKRWRG